jgi:NAD(P)-dependent dehydrogenase (short-subunit alcohol dehydrogenase family)
MSEAKNKVALITGAGQGIGRAIAHKLAIEGLSLVINDININTVRAVGDEISQMGGCVISVEADVSQKSQVAEMVNIAKSQFQTIHILVNNAGITYRASIIEHSEEKWNQVVDINLKGPFLCCQAVVPIMIEQKWGRIINISSMAYKGMGKQVAYDASKGGLNALTKSLALDLARYNITVNAVCPSWVETEMVTSPEYISIKEKFVRRVPMRRLAKPEEVAEVVCFLAKEEASYISGQNINIDGALMR